MNKKEVLSIVVPVFNETEVIAAFYERLKKVLDTMYFMSYEIIFVDDGSRDNSYQKLVKISHDDPNIKIVKLSRNFGHQTAITAGIDITKGNVIVVIDADLQDPPEVIKIFIEKWKEGYDVVYGIREKRKGETKLKVLTAYLFYRVMKRFIQINIPVDAGDFRLMSRRVVEQLKEMKERDRFVRGLVSWIGFKQTGVFYTRDERYAGITKYPYRKMIRFALDGITSFSIIPLKFASWIGFLASFLAFLYSCDVFIQKLSGYTVQGWATIMICILFLGGVQLICIGIMGEYMGRIFNEVKKRPMYIIDKIYSLKDGEEN